MSNELPTSATNGNGNGHGNNISSTFVVKTGLARMLKGGVIMDVVNAEQVRTLLFPFPLYHIPFIIIYQKQKIEKKSRH